MEAPKFWNIKILISRNRNVTVSANCAVDVLFEKAARLVSDEQKPEDLQLMFVGKTLKYGKCKKLSDYDIVDGSVVIVLLHLLGGVWPLDALRSKSEELEELPGYITITTSESEEDMISLDNSPTERRAKMPCGHVIGPSSMTSFCQSLISQGMFTFHCPAIIDDTNHSGRVICNKEWPYFLVRHVACLLPEEMQEFDKRISENYLHKAAGRLQCPSCKIWGFRTDTRSNRMKCTYCTRKKGKTYEFCWSCSSKWIGEDDCGNEGCDGRDKRIVILAECREKQIESIMAPSIRGCPNCGTLIEHKNDCKHMSCACGHSFCFFCLKPRAATGWSCKAYANDCEVAPRQTSIPGG